MVEIPDKAFAAWRSVHAVPQMDHVTTIGGISPPDWQTKPCERAGKTAGVECIDLAFRGFTSVPTDCAAWILDREADKPPNILKASKGLFPLITG